MNLFPFHYQIARIAVLMSLLCAIEVLSQTQTLPAQQITLGQAGGATHMRGIITWNNGTPSPHSRLEKRFTITPSPGRTNRVMFIWGRFSRTVVSRSWIHNDGTPSSNVTFNVLNQAGQQVPIHSLPDPVNFDAATLANSQPWASRWIDITGPTDFTFQVNFISPVQFYEGCITIWDYPFADGLSLGWYQMVTVDQTLPPSPPPPSPPTPPTPPTPPRGSSPIKPIIGWKLMRTPLRGKPFSFPVPIPLANHRDALLARIRLRSGLRLD